MKKRRVQGRLRMAADLRASLASRVRDSDEASLSYLHAQFLRSISRQLYSARVAAGLTQADLAERLHTTQSVISRTEADVTGAVSLRRFTDWLMACGTVPKAITIVAAESAQAAAVALLTPHDQSGIHPSYGDVDSGSLSAGGMSPRDFGKA